MKYDKKHMELCKKLGALKFQKIVFFVEKTKYKIIDQFFPNAFLNYNKNVDIKKEKVLEKYTDETEKRRIINFYRLEKLKFKRELIKKENRNYHINLTNPNEINKYLENNKNIHINGLKRNAVFSFLSITLGVAFSNPVPLLLYSFLIYQAFSAVINFQCINLQNYNLCRIEDKKVKKIFRKIEEKKIKQYSEKMNEGVKVIPKAMVSTTDIPTIDEVISSVSSNEEKKELLTYLRNRLLLSKNNTNAIIKTGGRSKTKC